LALSINNTKLYQEFLVRVDEGEPEAIALAKEIHAGLLLVDKRKGASLAPSLGIKTIGLLEVLLLSKGKEIIPSLKPTLD